MPSWKSNASPDRAGRSGALAAGPDTEPAQAHGDPHAPLPDTARGLQRGGEACPRRAGQTSPAAGDEPAQVPDAEVGKWGPVSCRRKSPPAPRGLSPGEGANAEGVLSEGRGEARCARGKPRHPTAPNALGSFHLATS
ncbi:uncharacterized protein LOC121351675 isoform X2 [Pyrgilauda ruficollis]|uniref:uncharacterized protein LOC121351675 isoform X2 n=1 Tax=Pyrgilauda ruficollis TaxID=221976 RepID=UPI001B883C84|nr:uncharacterized protein LOC121351675 isoform X2 [Pyrgilauda ruficollis]